MSLITLDQALAIVAAIESRMPVESVPLVEAAGRVLAAPIIATFDSPRTDVSMMDGYAVGEADGDVFDVIGQSAAGARFAGQIGVGQAVRIFTGAVVPAGATRVVMQENAAINGGSMRVVETAQSPHFIRAQGSDFRSGDVVVAAGIRLSPGALVAAAGAGADRVRVARRPRIVTIATGDELRSVGAPLGPDDIPDSIAPGLAAMIAAMGAEVVGQHLLGDDLSALEEAAAAAVKVADLVVVTGGASVGARDHAKAMFAPLDMELLFSKVAIKPGKPVWLGRVGAVLVIGLPGNPGSALVTARLLLAPLIAALLGQQKPTPLDWIGLPLGESIPTTGDRETFLRATLADGQLYPVDNQDSGAQRALGEAGWLIRCPAGQAPIGPGALVPALAL